MPSGSKPKVYPEHIVKRVRELYSSGLTQEEVGEKLGLSQKVIWKLMIRHNLKARVAFKRDQRGPKNHMWKGDNAKYQAMHLRVANLRGEPKACMECGTEDRRKDYQWASMTGKYQDPYDYRRLCRSCHAKQDNVIYNIRHMRKAVHDA